jgi:hypothetical protein
MARPCEQRDRGISNDQIHLKYREKWIVRVCVWFPRQPIQGIFGDAFLRSIGEYNHNRDGVFRATLQLDLFIIAAILEAAMFTQISMLQPTIRWCEYVYSRLTCFSVGCL